jgi:hypothetical protein
VWIRKKKSADTDEKNKKVEQWRNTEKKMFAEKE